MTVLRPIVGRLCAALIAPAAGAPAAPAQATATHATPVPAARAARLTGSISLDGKLDEAAWQASTPATGFRQQDPKEGEPASQRTEVRFLFDAAALYVGARMYDSLGARGVRTYLTRRDQQQDGDYLEIIFDTFHDHTGRTVFQINPSGVKTDAGQASSSADPSWDPIWEAATAIDSLGWTAELRIPFAQLRFSRDTSQQWGMQIWRYVDRLHEISMWSFWGKNAPGGTPHFGHLDGIVVTERPRGVEILPYVVGRGAYVPIPPAERDNPYRKEREYTGRVGGDVKALLTSNLTLDLTVNPDFGQVEVDPAVVNLTQFETSFSEKRPFFVEGSGLFGFGGLNCYVCSNVSSMSLYYSRRIGRAPGGSAPSGYDYLDRPENTTILGAAKITGRTKGGYQLGVLDAITRSETAELSFADGRPSTESEVEPLTNYFVGRARKTFPGGRGHIGVISTSVLRRFRNDALALEMSRHAEAVGVDGERWWKNRTYRLMGNVALSNVTGDPAVIRALQAAPARYFTRPDREHGENGWFSDRYDPTLTSLRGFGGYLRGSKDSGDWLFESAVNFRSPGFEVNDLAFLTRSDYVWMNVNAFRQWTKPGRYHRQAFWIAGAQQQYNFDRDLTDLQYHTFFQLQLPNYWGLSTFWSYRPEVFEDRLTRGGPVVRRAAGWSGSLDIDTDSRKRVVASINPSFSGNAEGGRGYGVYSQLRLKPTSNVNVSLEPYYSYSRGKAQFVRSFADTSANHFYDRRVVFSDLAQRTLELGTRLNVTFTPTLTLELFAQPLISSGDYSGFKEFAAARSVEKRIFDARQLTDTVLVGGARQYILDIDRDRATTHDTFRFGDPDFNFRSLRGNAVLRWEYRPGSTVFLVWTQNRASTDPVGDFRFHRDRRALLTADPANVFLVKVNYWIGL